MYNIRTVGVARFQEVLQYMESDPNMEENNVIVTLQGSATLVQGCWVLKSDLLYPTQSDTADGSDGVKPSVTALARGGGSKRRQSIYFTQAGTPNAVMRAAREKAVSIFISNTAF